MDRLGGAVLRAALHLFITNVRFLVRAAARRPKLAIKALAEALNCVHCFRQRLA